MLSEDLECIVGLLIIGLAIFCLFGLPQILEYLHERNKLKYGNKK